ncbi:MAG TPA: nitrate reductase molybdenum cofactor assembly chaperone [Gammaproteobacteria bacterium]|nr:nitrate reductase molybdenum cofactor assembly chaperone [Gammaproteobacteria bacterium]
MTQINHRTYKILGLLLRYPGYNLNKVYDECKQVLLDEALLSPAIINNIDKLINYLQSHDLLELEENYVSLFDFKSLLSLYLFEHLHGDSRDRGQALVDLVAHYEKHKLQLQPGEMPDYLPVFLEHLSFFSMEDSQKIIASYINIIVILERRLLEHKSPYSAVFSAIRSLSSSEPDAQYIEKVMKGYKKERDNKKELDEQWKEPEAFPKKCPLSCSTTKNINTFNKYDRLEAE